MNSPLCSKNPYDSFEVPNPYKIKEEQEKENTSLQKVKNCAAVVLKNSAKVVLTNGFWVSILVTTGFGLIVDGAKNKRPEEAIGGLGCLISGITWIFLSRKENDYDPRTGCCGCLCMNKV